MCNCYVSLQLKKKPGSKNPLGAGGGVNKKKKKKRKKGKPHPDSEDNKIDDNAQSVSDTVTEVTGNEIQTDGDINGGARKKKRKKNKKKKPSNSDTEEGSNTKIVIDAITEPKVEDQTEKASKTNNSAEQLEQTIDRKSKKRKKGKHTVGSQNTKNKKVCYDSTTYHGHGQTRKEKVDVSAWEEVFVPSPVLDALADLGFSQPTEIQVFVM